MNLFMKQKVFSWADQFSIWQDDPNTPAFTVQGEMFSWGKRLHVFDATGGEVAFINQKLWSWTPRFFVEIGGEQLATVIKEFSFFRPSYRIEGPDWRVEGEVLAHDYELRDEKGQLLMRLSKQWLTWGDSYELSIARDEDTLLCLCIALAIDAAMAVEEAAT